MPNPISNLTLTGDVYTDDATISGIWGHPRSGLNGGGTFDVSGGTVYYSLLYNNTDPRAQPSGFSSSDWTNDIRLRPSQGNIPPSAYGIRFKNADATVPATVNAYIAPPGQPALQINSTNDVTSTTVSAMVTGEVSSAGVVLAGSGFSVVRSGAGIYTITFTVAFAAPPRVVATVEQDVARFAYVAGAPTTSGCVVKTSTTVPGLADTQFSFVAVPTQ